MLDAQLRLQRRRSLSIVVTLAEPHQWSGVPARRKPRRNRILPGLQLLGDVICLVGNVGTEVVPSRRQNLIAGARAVDLDAIGAQRSYIKSRRGHRLADREAVAQ